MLLLVRACFAKRVWLAVIVVPVSGFINVSNVKSLFNILKSPLSGKSAKLPAVPSKSNCFEEAKVALPSLKLMVWDDGLSSVKLPLKLVKSFTAALSPISIPWLPSKDDG